LVSGSGQKVHGGGLVALYPLSSQAPTHVEVELGQHALSCKILKKIYIKIMTQFALK
jgi:hypothetical protein